MNAAHVPTLRALNVRFSTFSGELVRQAEPLHITPRGQLWVRMLDNGQRKLIDTTSLVMPSEMQARAAAPAVDDFEPLTVPSVYARDLPACRGNCEEGRHACAHPAVCATQADNSTDDDLPGPVTQPLALDQAERDLLAERRAMARFVFRMAALLGVVALGVQVIGCDRGAL